MGYMVRPKLCLDETPHHVAEPALLEAGVRLGRSATCLQIVYLDVRRSHGTLVERRYVPARPEYRRTGALSCTGVVCLTPLVRVSDSYKPNWFRVIPGFLLLGANMLPPLAWPVVFLTGIFLDDRTVERLTTAVPLFVRTLPIYISNLAAWSFSTASLVEIAYPIEIAGIKYRPVLQMGCTTRRMVSIDKAVSIHFFNDFPTLSGDSYWLAPEMRRS